MAQQHCRGDGVVAVSGGADSVGLLRLLAEGSAPDDRLVVAHLNHQLRGQESDADEVFVQNLVQQFDQQFAVSISFRSKRIDVPKKADECHDNLEATARRLRYDWLLEVCRAERAEWVATGHTADDQAETVLFRLLRGTGLKGLGGIPATRNLDEQVKVVRPLLRVRRTQLEAYLREMDQPFRSDASNSDVRFTRNRIRHQLLPLLQEDYNSNITGVLCQLAQQADAAYQSIEQRARQLLVKTELPRAGAMIVLQIADLQNESTYVVCEMFRLVWQREGWPMSAMTHDHWTKLAGMVDALDGECDFPGFIRASCRGRVLQLARSNEPRPSGSDGPMPHPGGRGT